MRGKRLAEKLHPIEHGHAKVGDEKIDVIFLKTTERLATVGDEMHFVTISGQLRAENSPQIGFIVRDEDLLAISNHEL
jgi:hypothetical protein